MFAVAISNNDMVYLYWNVESKIPGCLGFSVIRHDVKKDKGVALPAMVGFPDDAAPNPAKRPQLGKKYFHFENTNVWPVQKFAWKDLFATRGGTYWYEIVPMIGEPGKLRADRSQAMRTNTVTLDSNHGSCSVFFNRGIISTQSVARSLPKNKTRHAVDEGSEGPHRGSRRRPP